MHGEAANLLRKVKKNDTYRAKVADPLSPITFVDKINVPVFMACQWQDEQTGGHCPTLADRLTGTDKKWVTFTNGTHIDSLAPETFNRLYDFLKLYVAKQAPNTSSAAIQAAAPVIYSEAMGVDGVTLPPDPIQQAPTYEAALAAFEAQPPIRIDFDNGAGGEPGQPYPGYTRTFERFPVARHRGPDLAPLRERRPDRGPWQRGRRRVPLEPEGPPADELHRQHQRRRRRPLDRDARLRLAAAPGRAAPPPT